jgi:hypothetical protein
MLSKIQTDTRLSGRLLDQGTRLGRATNRVSSNLCALHSTSLAYHACSFLSRAKRRIFNRLQRFDSLPRCLANFLRISNFDIRVNLASYFLLSKSPSPFISLRGSKEPQGSSARAKLRVNLLIRTTQKSKTSKRPFRSRSTQLLKITAISARASGLHQLQ